MIKTTSRVDWFMLVCLCVCPYVCPSVCLFVCPSVFLSFHHHHYQSNYVYICTKDIKAWMCLCLIASLTWAQIKARIDPLCHHPMSLYCIYLKYHFITNCYSLKRLFKWIHKVKTLISVPYQYLLAPYLINCHRLVWTTRFWFFTICFTLVGWAWIN